MEEEEYNNTLIEINVKGIKKKFPLLKDIQYRLSKLLNYIKNNDKKNIDFNILKEMVSLIETNSELNFYFLKIMKGNDISYYENEKNWNYESNLNMLKETLTNKNYKLLTNLEHSNPLNELQLILKDYANCKDITIWKDKYGNKNMRLNFPLIAGIERLRVEYYITLILKNDIFDVCKLMESYINIMHKDKYIYDYSLDETNFCSKTYLLVLTLTKIFNIDNSELITKYFEKNITPFEGNKFKHIKLEKDGNYKVKTKNETVIIKGEDYFLEGLDNDISLYSRFPIKILLYRNESYKKYFEDDRKGFLKDLGLYNSFISYIKQFMKSNSFQEVLKQNNCYENIASLLNNNNYIDEMLNETHFQFLPFYGASNFFGYTNKDLEISFINSIPEIPNNIRIMNKEEISNVTNICLIFTIAVKFITCIHEFVIHLTYGYLYFFSSKSLDSDSIKERIDNDDGGFFFERKLNGGSKFEYLNINNAINLLDGISCEKKLSEFQEDIKCNVNVESLISRYEKKEFKGFIEKFLKEHPIDFNYFKKKSIMNARVACRGINEVGIYLNRYGSGSTGGRKAKI